MMENYSWPGNVRELRNLIERMVVGFDGAHIGRFQVQRQLTGDRPLSDRTAEGCEGGLEHMLEAYEKEILSNLIIRHKNASEVARILNVNKSTISRKLKKYGIKI
jgi:DNA-binding NtrC family response regulator